MYQKISYALAVVLFGIVMTGCTTYSYTSRSAAIRGTTIDSRALGTEITADFAHKVTASSDPQTTLSAAKNQAVFLCLQQKDVEVVVDPVYQIEYRWFKKKPYTVTVMGFAGKYKQVPNGLDAFVAKNYSKEDIEKWLLLNDPNFVNLYYQKEKKDVLHQGGDVTNYYINSNGDVTPVTKSRLKQVKAEAPVAAPASSVMLKTSNMQKNQTVKPLKPYKQSKQIRDAGAWLMGLGGGLVFIGGGATIAAIENCKENENRYRYDYETYKYYRDKRDACEIAHIVLPSIGFVCIAAGIPMVSVGQVRMNKANKATIALGGTGDGLGMRLTF